MKSRFVIVALALVLAACASAPRVIRTAPHQAAVVSATTDELRVVFDRPMQDVSWSYVRSARGAFPEMIGAPRRLPDQRTFVVRVHLEPNTAYVVGFNTIEFNHFRDMKGRPARPFELHFTTGPQ